MGQAWESISYIINCGQIEINHCDTGQIAAIGQNVPPRIDCQ
jgi:hypothetical protein